MMSEGTTLIGIPVIDIGLYFSGDRKVKLTIAKNIAAACRNTGFLVIKNHSLSPQILESGFRMSQHFFGLPIASKDQYRPTGLSKQRGYHEFASRGLANTLRLGALPDLRESNFLGPLEDFRNDYIHVPEAQTSYWPNTLPTTPKGFSEALVSLYRSFDDLSRDLLQNFALALNMPEDYSIDKTNKHFSIMSSHYYPNNLAQGSFEQDHTRTSEP